MKPARLGLIATVYFLPSMLAVARHHRNGSAVFLLNLLAGWTVVGWVISLIWATIKDPSSY
ncbi:MAG: superinfection immunity protein [Dehalococcoidia bacterium]